MKKLALHKVIIVAATVALGSFSIATDALARGGGGGGGHGGGGGGHFGGGGGAHFGGGGAFGGSGGAAHFGGSGMHMGGGHIGGAQFGGGHFGGSHIGGTSLGGVHLGGASRAGARSSMASAHLSGRHVGAGLATTSGFHSAHARLHDRTHRHRLGFARGLGYDAYGYDDDACWDSYRVRLHSHWNWRRRWICG
jgi:hypothetical protein